MTANLKKCAFCDAPATFSPVCEECGNLPKKCPICGKKGSGRCKQTRPGQQPRACLRRYKLRNGHLLEDLSDDRVGLLLSLVKTFL